MKEKFLFYLMFFENYFFLEAARRTHVPIPSRVVDQVVMIVWNLQLVHVAMQIFLIIGSHVTFWCSVYVSVCMCLTRVGISKFCLILDMPKSEHIPREARSKPEGGARFARKLVWKRKKMDKIKQIPRWRHRKIL